MIVAELDEVTFDVEADGELVRRQLERRVWERGGWATVAVVYAERSPGGDWKPPKLTLLRFRRVRDAWRKHAAITLRGPDALALIGTLEGWRPALAGDDGDGGAGDDDDDDD
jgi:hypothetical protein